MQLLKLTIKMFCIFLFVGFTLNADDVLNHENLEKATFAGGCFWCMQPPFDQLDGVVSTKVGYTGGKTINPTYIQVSEGKTGHVEAVEIAYDPKKISYEKLLLVYWHNIDPTDKKGQFCDKGSAYRPMIFYHNEKQKQLAVESKQTLIQANKINPIVTEIVSAPLFYPAEEYHQQYYKKNPFRYRFYRYLCGRDKRLKEIWGDAVAPLMNH